MMYRCPNERQTNNNERQTGNKEQEVEGLFIVVGVFVHGVLSAVQFQENVPGLGLFMILRTFGQAFY